MKWFKKWPHSLTEEADKEQKNKVTKENSIEWLKMRGHSHLGLELLGTLSWKGNKKWIHQICNSVEFTLRVIKGSGSVLMQLLLTLLEQVDWDIYFQEAKLDKFSVRIMSYIYSHFHAQSLSTQLGCTGSVQTQVKFWTGLQVHSPGHK